MTKALHSVLLKEGAAFFAAHSVARKERAPGLNGHYTLQTDRLKEKQMAAPVAGAMGFHGAFSPHGFTEIQAQGPVLSRAGWARGTGGSWEDGEGGGVAAGEALTKGGAVSSLLQGSVHCFLDQ